MNRRRNLILLPLGLLCVIYLFINLNVQNIFKVAHTISEYQDRYRYIKIQNNSNVNILQSEDNLYHSIIQSSETNQSIKSFNISDRNVESNQKIQLEDKIIDITNKTMDNKVKNDHSSSTLNKTVESLEIVGQENEINDTERKTNKQNEKILKLNDTILKSKNIPGVIEIGDNSVETVEIATKINLTILDIDKMLLPESDTKWPVVVMKNNGRTGNCFNSYAISLALNQEFGDKATIAVQHNVHELVAKVIDPRGLILPIAEKTIDQQASEKKMSVIPPGKFYVKHDYVAHIKPSINFEITNFQTTKKKKIMFIGGYPNRMHMIADYLDEIRRRFRVREELLVKAQTFLHKVSKVRPPGLVFVGFHIRRTDYIAHSQNYNGVSVPGPKYYIDALNHYRQLFDNVLFVVASDDLSYALSHLQVHKDVVFTEFKKLEEDMALLSACNHSIMTVGSFGWWSSFLAGGDVVYALLYNYTIPPFAHPEMLGPHGFENFHGIPVKDE